MAKAFLPKDTAAYSSSSTAIPTPKSGDLMIYSACRLLPPPPHLLHTCLLLPAQLYASHKSNHSSHCDYALLKRKSQGSLLWPCTHWAHFYHRLLHTSSLHLGCSPIAHSSKWMPSGTNPLPPHRFPLPPARLPFCYRLSRFHRSLLVDLSEDLFDVGEIFWLTAASLLGSVLAPASPNIHDAIIVEVPSNYVCTIQLDIKLNFNSGQRVGISLSLRNLSS